MTEYINKKDFSDWLEKYYEVTKQNYDNPRFAHNREFYKGQIAALLAVSAKLEDSRPANVVEVVHGEWIEVTLNDDEDYPYHICSQCKCRAIFDYIYEDNYEVDGYGDYIGQIDTGIREHLSIDCPHCGAKMDKGDYNGVLYQTQKAFEKGLNNGD